MSRKLTVLIAITITILFLQCYSLTHVNADSADDWPTFHKDFSRSGKSSSKAPMMVNRAHLLWSHATDGFIISSPAVVDGMVYIVSADGYVYCLDATTGSRIWSHKGEGSPTVIDERVYVGSLCLNATTGHEMWDSKIKTDVAPAVYDDMVFVCSESSIFALNASSGREIWNNKVGDLILSSPAVVDDVVYIGSEDRRFYAFNASTGAKTCMHTVEGYVPSSPAVADGIVYLGTGEPNTIYAVNASTSRGRRVWMYQTDGIVFSSPSVASGVVYSGTHLGSILALNASTGDPIWSHKTNSPIHSSPAVAHGVVFVGSDDYSMHALNASTGDEIWSYRFGGQIKSSPAIVDGIIYVGCNDGKVYALQLLGPAKSSNISCSVSPSIITKGDSFTVFGSVNPAVSNQSIRLTYEKPGGITLNGTVTSDSDGSFSHSIRPDAVGIWNVTVSWEGDVTYYGTADSRSFIVSSQTYTEPGGVSKPASFFTYAIVGVSVFCFGGYATYLFRKKR